MEDKPNQCIKCGKRTKKNGVLYRVGDSLLCNRHLQPYINNVWCSSCGDTGFIEIGTIMVCPRCRSYIVIDGYDNYHSNVEQHQEWLKANAFWCGEKMVENIYIAKTKKVIT